VLRVKEALHELGYFENRMNPTYYRTLEVAARVFAQQMKLGGESKDGAEISPLMQAMLADWQNLPRAVCPNINIYLYSSTGDELQYLPFEWSRLQRSDTREGRSVGLQGVVGQVQDTGSLQLFVLWVGGDAARPVYVTYQPLPRTTRFQAGDKVAVFGVTQGFQAFEALGLDGEAVAVKADRVGYAP